MQQGVFSEAVCGNRAAEIFGFDLGCEAKRKRVAPVTGERVCGASGLYIRLLFDDVGPLGREAFARIRLTGHSAVGKRTMQPEGWTMPYKNVVRRQKAFATGLQRFSSVEEMIGTLRPGHSVHCMHPEKLHEAARTFVEHFPGHSLYAIKSNPDPYVLETLHKAGINHFDVASLGEVRLIRTMFPRAHLAFMNPVKSREAIRAAYFEYGVRDFVADTADEIDKIVEETDRAQDLLIVVRIAMPKGSAACALTGKFGCTPDQAVELLKIASSVAKTGISFHVGSQTLSPSSYADAIRKGGEVIARAGVKPKVFDVGGGFPVKGLGMEILPLEAYFDIIRAEIAALKLPKSCEIWAEPGRALSGECSTLVVKVNLRKGDLLYINDGSFGNMFEIASMNWKNDCALYRLPRKNEETAAPSSKLAPFRFYGPTCDSVDYMAGPFLLPEDANEGDYIALEGMGAYMACSQSRFNGFFSDAKVEIVSTTRTTQLKVVK
ncbi:MAG: type III PLP-dependent enzyme [Alphaproteobacteria bacterium]|nr:type III PLP-dependent enzyme [Alphaproteobacteria bacterium]